MCTTVSPAAGASLALGGWEVVLGGMFRGAKCRKDRWADGRFGELKVGGPGLVREVYVRPGHLQDAKELAVCKNPIRN